MVSVAGENAKSVAQCKDRHRNMVQASKYWPITHGQINGVTQLQNPDISCFIDTFFVDPYAHIQLS